MSSLRKENIHFDICYYLDEGSIIKFINNGDIEIVYHRCHNGLLYKDEVICLDITNRPGLLDETSGEWSRFRANNIFNNCGCGGEKKKPTNTFIMPAK